MATDFSAEVEAESLRTRLDKLVTLNESRLVELNRQRRRTAEAEAKLEEAEKALHLIRSIKEANPTVPKWRAEPTARRKKGSQRRGIPTLLISDTHFDEVVNPAEVEWYNAYDREIAEARLEHTFRTGIELARDYVTGVDFDGAVIMLGGDIVTGDIHQELARTNEATVFDSVVHWVPLLAAGIEMWAEEFGKVHVPAVVGNHDRSPANRRVPAKRTARDSFTWIIYQWLADRFAGDSRVTFDVAEGRDTAVQVYGTRYLLTHGDQFRGGNGIAGVYSPISRGNAKKQVRQSRIGRPYDWLVMGHFHQWLAGRGFIINGSLKGYDEYAYGENLEPEPPQQGFWITTPEHGISMSMPIFAEAKDEAWRRSAE